MKIDSRGQCVEALLGKAITMTKRPDAPLRVLVAGHMDTVYGPDDPSVPGDR